MATASKVLSIAAGEIGYIALQDPEKGSKYGRYFAEKLNQSWLAASSTAVPWCALFASWCLDQAGQSCSGMPTASCATALSGAKKAGLVRSNKKDAKAGDLVLFDWNGNGQPDHIGIVEKNCGSYIQTIEGNTSSGNSGSQSNGGGVYRRTRNWGYVLAIIAVPYDGQSSGSASSSGKLAVDGYVGPATVKEWQKQRGTTQDGVISGQSASDKAAHERINAIRYGSGGSLLVESLQSFLTEQGYTVTVDGYMGKNTVKALQKWMREKLGYKKHAIDGILGEYTAYNVQNALNSGAFKG